MKKRSPVPGWVPDGVKAMHQVAEMDNEIAWRLLTDERLEKAWEDLRTMPEPLDIEDRIKRIDRAFSPDKYGKPCCALTNFDRQAAALYYEIVLEMHQLQRTYWSAADARKIAKPYLDAAKQCEIAIEEDELLRWRPDIIDALRIAGAYLGQQGEMRSMRGNPRVVGHSLDPASDEKRGHSQFIATKVVELFAPVGKFPNAIIARFLAVSLDLEDDIELLRDSVYEWCKRLRDGRLG